MKLGSDLDQFKSPRKEDSAVDNLSIPTKDIKIGQDIKLNHHQKLLNFNREKLNSYSDLDSDSVYN